MPDATFGDSYLQYQCRRSRARQIVRAMYLRHQRRLCIGPTLDFGCGAGDLLSQLPAGSAGLEVNPAAVAHCRARGLPVELYDPASDGYALRSVRPGAFQTLACNHVLEHLESPEVVAERLLAACDRLGIARVVFTVPGRKGFAHDPTHRVFVDRALFERHGLLPPRGWRIAHLRHFPVDLALLGDLFTHHELSVAYDRAPA